jgi:hypothetical protein
MGTVGLLMIFFLRIFVAQGWYIGTLFLLPISLEVIIVNVGNSGILAGNLPPEPLPRVPATQIRPLERSHRHRDGRRLRRRPPHETRRGVPSLHPPPPRVQVLVLGHEGYYNWLCMHLVLDLRCPSFLAGFGGLLVDSVCFDEYVPWSRVEVEGHANAE